MPAEVMTCSTRYDPTDTPLIALWDKVKLEGKWFLRLYIYIMNRYMHRSDMCTTDPMGSHKVYYCTTEYMFSTLLEETIGQ